MPPRILPWGQRCKAVAVISLQPSFLSPLQELAVRQPTALDRLRS